jgi:hypothetical protein
VGLVLLPLLSLLLDPGKVLPLVPDELLPLLPGDSAPPVAVPLLETPKYEKILWRQPG